MTAAARDATGSIDETVVAKPTPDWSIPTAIEWIVYRGNGTAPSYPGNGPESSEHVLAALEARANGNPRSWLGLNEDGGRCGRFARARVRDWMRRSGLKASDLLEVAKAARQQWLQACKDAESYASVAATALDDINDAVASRRISAWGRPAPTWQALNAFPRRKRLPASTIDERRRIGVDSSVSLSEGDTGFDWLKDRGPFYHEVAVNSAQVKAAWPETASVETAVTAISLRCGEVDQKVLHSGTAGT